MKTCLYQPIFINPQAYFVFPQLYHIEKGDSYIEPANITGQLIINDLTQSLTSTPILNVVQDTNQVDFGLFKGKHIRINSIHGVNNLLIELTYTGSIGSKWEEFDDELLYKPYIRTKGTFAQKPLSSQGIQQGFSYFCTDKQTVEGSRSGIMIYYAGNDTWVDALGRYV